MRNIRAAFAAVVMLGLVAAGPARAEQSLLNASYDVMREFYKDYNAAFARYWKQKTGQEPKLQQSHGGSSKQARAVADGLEADVVTMNQANDIDMLAERGLVPANWQTRLPDASAPFTSTIVFLVRKGNPKAIRDWNDLVKPGVAVLIPNPKTAGNGRYSYLAAWAYASRKGGDAAARDFVAKLFRNVPVLDTGGRGATSSFVQRNLGDVLLTFESEVFQIRKEFGDTAQFEVVYPSMSILAEPPVSVVDRVVDKRGTRALATAYLEYLWSDEGQEIAARHWLRPRKPAVAARHAASFRKIDLVTVDREFGGWKKAQAVHFKDGGEFDAIWKTTGK